MLDRNWRHARSRIPPTRLGASHSTDAKDSGLLCADALSTDKQLPTFRMNPRLPDPPYWKHYDRVQGRLTTQQTTLCNIPEDLDHSELPMRHAHLTQCVNFTSPRRALHKAPGPSFLHSLFILQRGCYHDPLPRRNDGHRVLLGLKRNAWRSSWTWRRVVWYEQADFSEEPTASNLSVPENWGKSYHIPNLQHSSRSRLFERSWNVKDIVRLQFGSHNYRVCYHSE